jgi:hypothetical protein
MEVIKMEHEQVRQLLERYWQCKTSIEEEKLLQAFFSGKEIPEAFAVYKPLFAWRGKQKSERASKKFIFTQRKSLWDNFYPALKIAASVLIMIVLGISAYTRYHQEKFMDKVFSETFTNPEDAVKETGEVVAKVSSLLQLIPEKIVPVEESDSMDSRELKINDSLE